MSSNHSAAIAALFQQHHRAYVEYARHRLGTKNHHHADDVVQSGMERVVRAATRYQTPPTHYVALWAINKAALDLFRTKRRGDAISFDAEFGDESGQSLYDIVADTHSAAQTQVVESKAAFALVLETVNRLPEGSAQLAAWDLRVEASFDPDLVRELVARADPSAAAWSRHTTHWCALQARLEATLRKHGFENML